MTLLAAVPVIYALVIYCKVRQNPDITPRQAFLKFCLIVVLLLSGILFKENAVLLVLFIFAIEVFLLHFKAPSRGQQLFLRLYFGVLVVVPAVLGFLILIFAPDKIIGGYDVRAFTMGERLLTEARVIWMYIYWLILPDTRQFTLHHDNFPISHGLFDPISTLTSILGLIALIALAWKLRQRFALLSFGVAFFLAGHALESTVVPLELVFEHRNYLPGFGLLFAGVFALMNLPAYILGKQAASFFLAFYLLFLTQGTFLKAAEWSNQYEQLNNAVQINPDSHRINYELGFMYLQVASATPDRNTTLEAASDYFRRAAVLDPQATRAHAGYILAQTQLGKPVSSEVSEDLAYRWQHYALGRNSLTEISMLTECWYSGFCSFDKSMLIGFYNAIAANEASDPILAQGILDQIGTAIAEVFNNKEDGKALLYMAESKRDDLTIIDLKLIRLEMETGNRDKAREVLRAALAKPRNDNFTAQLQSLATDLELP